MSSIRPIAVVGLFALVGCTGARPSVSIRVLTNVGSSGTQVLEGAFESSWSVAEKPWFQDGVITDSGVTLLDQELWIYHFDLEGTLIRPLSQSPCRPKKSTAWRYPRLSADGLALSIMDKESTCLHSLWPSTGTSGEQLWVIPKGDVLGSRVFSLPRESMQGILRIQDDKNGVQVQRYEWGEGAVIQVIWVPKESPERGLQTVAVSPGEKYIALNLARVDAGGKRANLSQIVVTPLGGEGEAEVVLRRNSWSTITAWANEETVIAVDEESVCFVPVGQGSEHCVLYSGTPSVNPLAYDPISEQLAIRAGNDLEVVRVNDGWSRVGALRGLKGHVPTKFRFGPGGKMLAIYKEVSIILD